MFSNTKPPFRRSSWTDWTSVFAAVAVVFALVTLLVVQPIR